MKIENRYDEAAIFISSQNSVKILETYTTQKPNSKRTYVVYMKNKKNKKNI
jgi:hypothetical protein